MRTWLEAKRERLTQPYTSGATVNPTSPMLLDMGPADTIPPIYNFQNKDLFIYGSIPYIISYASLQLGADRILVWWRRALKILLHMPFFTNIRRGRRSISAKALESHVFLWIIFTWMNRHHRCLLRSYFYLHGGFHKEKIIKEERRS